MANIYGNRLPQQTEAGDYDLPDQRYLQVGAPPVSPNIQGPAAMGQPQDNLAEVEGMTGDYYNTFAKLKSYTEGLWKDFGVDAAKPDYSQPGGGTAFKTFQKLQANLMHTSNKLGNYLKEQNQMRPAIAAHETVALDNPNGDPTQPLYVSTKNSPELTHAATVADVLRNSPAESHRADIPIKEVKDSFYKKWQDALAKGDHAEAEYWGGEYLKASHLHSQYSTIKTDLVDERAKLRQQHGGSMEAQLTKRISALSQGFGPKTEWENVEDNGQAAKVNRSFAGEVWDMAVNDSGKQVPIRITGWKRKGGKTYLQLEKNVDVPEEQTQDVEVSNLTPDVIMANLQKHNSKFGTAPKMYESGHALGWTNPDQSGGFVPEQVHGDEYNNLAQQRAGMDQEIQSQNTLVKSKADFKEKFPSVTSEDIQLPNGSTLNVERKWGKGWEITDGGKSLGLFKTKEEAANALEQKGYFGGGAAAPAETVPQIHSQEEYDALVPGSQYIDSNGKKATKK